MNRHVVGFLLVEFAVCLGSVVVQNAEQSAVFQRKVEVPLPVRKEADLNEQETPKLDLLIDVKSITRSQMFGNRQRKHRRGDKVRRRKEKHGKLGKQRNKVSIKTVDLETKQVLRNHEKVTLVRNKTIEILKNGVRILSTDEDHEHHGNKSASRVNETLLEKILSSAVSKPDLLISASGIYKLPIGGDIYSSKKLSKPEETYVHRNQTDDGPNTTTEYFAGVYEEDETKRKKNRTEEARDYEDYEGFEDFKDWGGPNETKAFANAGDYESVNLDDNIGSTLEHIVSVLQNLSTAGGNCSQVVFANCSGADYPNSLPSWEGDDQCRKWLECKENLESAFSGEHHSLPSCPCHYPSTIFYDDKIWDDKQTRYFRWKDASGEAERLDIYKPGAAYCIRSLLNQGSSTISSQHCCYDRELRLLTRGSGAGTINFVSPDISKKLHDTVDMLPWRLCKGDFTRYNLARQPDNSNNCPVNPDNEQYQLQVEVSKYF